MNELTLDPRTTAIVVIDLQKGITQYPTVPFTAQTVIANAAQILAAARRAGAQPILVHVSLSVDGRDRLQSISDQPMRATLTPPPDWADFVPELDRQPSDLEIVKRQWGAFYGTDLDMQLRHRGLSTIVLCGIATEAGVESTARDAYERGYHLVFASDAMAGIHAESHANAVERIFPRIGRVRTTQQILAALEPSAGV